jgi:hypothetical protein
MGVRCDCNLDRSFALADVAIEVSMTRKPDGLLLVGLLVWPINAFAYRPFDSTDAAVAERGAFEVELSPLSYRHDDDGTAWITPSARLNYGFSDNWEIVLEGQGEHFAHQPSRLTEAALSLKTVVREGSLQEKSGWSLASEESVLLPGIKADNGAGLEWTGIASQRWDWGTIHLNLAAELTREQRAGAFAGVIIEGPDRWRVRPVAEINYQREFGAGETTSALLGVIWQAEKDLAFDFALRHAWVDHRPGEQIRAGIMFAFH